VDRFRLTLRAIWVLFRHGGHQGEPKLDVCPQRVGLIFTPVGLAIAYYFIPKVLKTPAVSHKLSMIGFWGWPSCTFLTGAHHMLHGPSRQWAPDHRHRLLGDAAEFRCGRWFTISFATMKGQWHQLKDKRAAEFLMSGVVVLSASPGFQGPMHSLRTVNAIVRRRMDPGHAHMAVLGAFSFFAIAARTHGSPRL